METPLTGTALWTARVRSRSRWARRKVAWATRRTTSAWRALPDFLVIGAAKSGTTSLYEYLAAHPLVCPPTTKEIRYFAYHSDKSVGWYRAHFPTRREVDRTGRAEGGRAQTGEASPAYLSHPAAPARAHALVPDAKLMVVLRDPVERATSAYHFATDSGHEHRPIEAAIADNVRRLEVDEPLSAHDDFDGSLRLNNYISRGHYAEALERWYEHFDRSQILILEANTLSRNGDGFARVLEHLGLPAWRPEKFVEHNVGSYEPAPGSVRRALVEHYRPYNAELWELLGEDWGWDEDAEPVTR